MPAMPGLERGTAADGAFHLALGHASSRPHLRYAYTPSRSKRPVLPKNRNSGKMACQNQQPQATRGDVNEVPYQDRGLGQQGYCWVQSSNAS